MKRLLFVLVFWMGAYPAAAQIEIEAAPSETVELMFVMMSLTGASQFNPPHVLPEYKDFVDSWFAGHKNHSAIRFIVKTVFKERTDMVLPATIGVNSDIQNGEFVYTGNYYGWSEKTKERFEEEVNKFYNDTNFRAFWERARDNLYPSITRTFNNVIVPKLNSEWLDRFVPVEEKINYGLTLSLLSGAYNFGAVRSGVPNPVIGIWDMELISNPTEKTLEIYLPLTVHEYLHAFCNPLIDKYYSELKRPGEVIFPKIARQMSRAHYGEWRIVLYESLVRASEIAFMKSDDFLSQFAESGIERNRRMGFYWIGELADLMSEYEASRDRYPTLDDFMPRIIDLYNEMAYR